MQKNFLLLDLISFVMYLTMKVMSW